MFSLVYTSRRPAMMKHIIDQWRGKAAVPANIEIIISIDANDPDSLRVMNNEGKDWGVKWVVQNQAPFNCVRGWNKGAESATGKIIIAISDDFIPLLQWDYRLLTLPYQNWVEGEFVVHVNDGFVKDICTMPILTRKRYDRFGYIFYPRFESMFCDTDLTERAKQDGVLLDAMHLLFEHHHPSNKKRTMDQVDINHASNERWVRGEMLFNFRKTQGFPIDDGPKASEFISLTSVPTDIANKYAVYIQATKDDFCLQDVCNRAMQEGISHFFFCVPNQYWSGKVTPPEDIAQIQAVHDELNRRGAKSQLTVFDVENYKAPGRPRIEVETHLRNDSLAMIQSAGFDHILIMDGDELWVPGLLKRVDDEVRRRQPQSLQCRMVPVVGLPGYPINDAKDTITIYIHSENRFRDCRSPLGMGFLMEFYGVVHFTACRKSLDEIAEKHRQSGHYDDPDYDMEGWIQNILPKVRPGMKNVHMFKKWQIWPEARNWTAEELNYIPSHLHQYLGIEHQVTGGLRSPVNALQFVDNLTRTTIPQETSCQFSAGQLVRAKKLVTRCS
jgi:hypothetical protein